MYMVFAFLCVAKALNALNSQHRFLENCPFSIQRSWMTAISIHDSRRNYHIKSGKTLLYIHPLLCLSKAAYLSYQFTNPTNEYFIKHPL